MIDVGYNRLAAVIHRKMLYGHPLLTAAPVVLQRAHLRCERSSKGRERSCSTVLFSYVNRNVRIRS